MNNGDDALIGREQFPINRITLEGIDGNGDVGVFPGFVEFGGLGADGKRSETNRD